MEDLSSLLERIQALVDGRDDVVPELRLERMEHTLTDGYARALELEAESGRLGKEIASAAGAGDGSAKELRTLAGRLAQNEDDLRALRRELAALRRSVYDARATAEAAPAPRVKARRR
jgi:predicted  nucleic acid-binding Zn-ribbon protein